MSEVKRLEELYAHQILDTPSEKKLDDIVEIAATLCDTPIAAISFFDKDRQWFKAKKGVFIDEIASLNDICLYAIANPSKVLVVEDAILDVRFTKVSSFDIGKKTIRFLVNVPLTTLEGHVLGVLSVMDLKLGKITPRKINALKLLALEVVQYLQSKKAIYAQELTLKKGTMALERFSNQSTSIFLQFEIDAQGKLNFLFISKGINKIHPSLDDEKILENPEEIYTIIHPDDLSYLKQTILDSCVNLRMWQSEFRIVSENGIVSWHEGMAKPVKKEDGKVMWYGTFQDISSKKEYVKTLEQMSFDISHVLRKPITTLMSIISVIEIEKDMDEQSLKMYAGYLKSVGEELDKFTKMLNDSYYDKWMGTQE
ncbi:PAS domain-containing protein [Maribacter sp. R77961]|uniref:PAS domain-containing protein n=1 Tax=Maribacter sp. R77961 TaxID=3093871 RepID=UPI0037CAE01F